MKPSTYTSSQRQAAARAWQNNGHFGLSRWLSRVRPRFGLVEYGEAVQVAREELNDWTDYSADTGAHEQEEDNATT